MLTNHNKVTRQLFPAVACGSTGALSVTLAASIPIHRAHEVEHTYPPDPGGRGTGASNPSQT